MNDDYEPPLPEIFARDNERMSERMGEGEIEGEDFGSWRTPCCGTDYDCICS